MMRTCSPRITCVPSHGQRSVQDTDQLRSIASLGHSHHQSLTRLGNGHVFPNYSHLHCPSWSHLLFILQWSSVHVVQQSLVSLASLAHLLDLQLPVSSPAALLPVSSPAFLLS